MTTGAWPERRLFGAARSPVDRCPGAPHPSSPGRRSHRIDAPMQIEGAMAGDGSSSCTWVQQMRAPTPGALDTSRRGNHSRGICSPGSSADRTYPTAFPDPPASATASGSRRSPSPAQLWRLRGAAFPARLPARHDPRQDGVRQTRGAPSEKPPPDAPTPCAAPSFPHLTPSPRRTAPQTSILQDMRQLDRGKI